MQTISRRHFEEAVAMERLAEQCECDEVARFRADVFGCGLNHFDPHDELAGLAESGEIEDVMRELAEAWEED